MSAVTISVDSQVLGDVMVSRDDAVGSLNRAEQRERIARMLDDALAQVHAAYGITGADLGMKAAQA